MPSQSSAGPPDADACKQAAATCACFNFRKATRVVTQRFDEALASSGVRSTQLVILLAVRMYDQVTAAELADVLVTDRSTLTRNLRPLVKRRLLHINPGKDRRTRVISLTPAGLKALADAVPLWENAQKRFVKELGAPRWTRLLRDLNATVDAARNNDQE